jgi:hypothetical protein
VDESDGTRSADVSLLGLRADDGRVPI